MSEDKHEVKQEMIIRPAQHGGYIISDAYDKFYFAGELDDVLDFIREQYEPAPILTKAAMQEMFTPDISGTFETTFEIPPLGEQLEKRLDELRELMIKAWSDPPKPEPAKTFHPEGDAGYGASEAQPADPVGKSKSTRASESFNKRLFEAAFGKPGEIGKSEEQTYSVRAINGKIYTFRESPIEIDGERV